MKDLTLKITKIGLFIALLVTGFILQRYAFDYQMQLSQGDHGLNLYAAEAVLNGARPYHDFHWFYGPLMPYFYALCFKLFGISIKSILIGKAFLTIAASTGIFLTLSLICTPLLSLLGALYFYFFQNDFFYTYNHIGAITLNIYTLYYLCRYFKHNTLPNLYGALVFAFLVGMIKLNLGAASLCAIIICALIKSKLFFNADAPKLTKFYCASLITVPISWLIANFVFVRGLPFHIIKQGYQYFGNDAFAQEYPNIFTNIFTLLKHNYYTTVHAPFNLFLCILILSSVPILLKKKKLEAMPYLVAFLIFYILQLHEYLISGIMFRAFWSESFGLLIIFSIIGLLLNSLSKSIKILILGLLAMYLGLSITMNIHQLQKLKTPFTHLNIPKANIYVGNTLEWKVTLDKTLEFINKNVAEDELFFATPYEPLIYFLADKPSPTRQLAFFDFVNMPRVQEEAIIDDLDNSNTNWIIMSNRASSNENGLGQFGVTNAKLIGQYIKTHFTRVEQFGAWTQETDWTSNYGVRIFKRKEGVRSH